MLLEGCSMKSVSTMIIESGIYNDSVFFNSLVPEAVSSGYGLSTDSCVYAPNEYDKDETRKLIRTVEVDMRVDEAESLQGIVQQVQLLTQQYDGYITYNSINMNDGNDYAYLKL